jgi:hypothetical protein
MYTVQDSRGDTLLHSYCKAWHFGVDGCDLNDLEKFFETLSSEIKQPPIDWIHQFLAYTREDLDKIEKRARERGLTVTFHADLGFVVYQDDGIRYEIGYTPDLVHAFITGYAEGSGE